MAAPFRGVPESRHAANVASGHCPYVLRANRNVLRVFSAKGNLKGAGVRGGEDKDQETVTTRDSSREPRYVPPLTSGPLVEANQPKPTVKPQAGE
ncbi:hypothetical protein CEXT_744481 [Caerostris extrusa]|uniref:Uncharacterized protein n=1 Tax=Caerostris extrusa TaxID=172846 RepID=A0AAV4ML71_CAEEX|nr:hypothetical protein CEXT_744481 [Caerostris extrusa]